MIFCELVEARSAARARAVEDFEFFACGVLGVRASREVCRVVQAHVEHSTPLALEVTRDARLLQALEQWLVVLGRKSPSGATCGLTSETFTWLFPQEGVAA